MITRSLREMGQLHPLKLVTAKRFLLLVSKTSLVLTSQRLVMTGQQERQFLATRDWCAERYISHDPMQCMSSSAKNVWTTASTSDIRGPTPGSAFCTLP